MLDRRETEWRGAVCICADRAEELEAAGQGNKLEGYCAFSGAIKWELWLHPKLTFRSLN